MIFCPERDTTEERRQQLAPKASQVSCIMHGHRGPECGPECARLTKTWNDAKPAPQPVSWFSLAARTI